MEFYNEWISFKWNIYRNEHNPNTDFVWGYIKAFPSELQDPAWIYATPDNTKRGTFGGKQYRMFIFPTSSVKEGRVDGWTQLVLPDDYFVFSLEGTSYLFIPEQYAYPPGKKFEESGVSESDQFTLVSFKPVLVQPVPQDKGPRYIYAGVPKIDVKDNDDRFVQEPFWIEGMLGNSEHLKEYKDMKDIWRVRYSVYDVRLGKVEGWTTRAFPYYAVSGAKDSNPDMPEGYVDLYFPDRYFRTYLKPGLDMWYPSNWRRDPPCRYY